MSLCRGEGGGEGEGAWAVAALFVTSALFVTKVRKRVRFEALSARFVSPASFVTCGWGGVGVGVGGLQREIQTGRQPDRHTDGEETVKG